jgi:hypothetical protein
VTNAVVRLHRRHYGKGPTRSKSYLLIEIFLLEPLSPPPGA